MKNLVYVFVTLFLFVGCSYKNESINLPVYNVNYAGESSKANKTVFIESVDDVRADKGSIGYTLENGQKNVKLYSNVDFEKKYFNALKNTLYTAGFNIAENKSEEALIVKVNIKNIKLVYNDKSFDENINGVIELEVIVTKGKEVVTQNFKQKAGKWIAPSYSSKDMEPLLYELFSESINGVVSRLTRY